MKNERNNYYIKVEKGRMSFSAEEGDEYSPVGNVRCRRELQSRGGPAEEKRGGRFARNSFKYITMVAWGEQATWGFAPV